MSAEKRLQQEVMQLLKEQGGSEVDIRRSITDGINATAKDVQAALRRLLERKLKFESVSVKKLYFNRMSKIIKFAKNNDHQAVVATQPIEGTVILEMEKGGVERPDAGRQFLATPTDKAVGGKNGKVASRYRFANMGLKREGDSLEGVNGIFSIKGVGIFKRSKKGLVMLYALNPHRVIRKLLTWKLTARKVMESRLSINIRAAHIARMARRRAGGAGKP